VTITADTIATCDRLRRLIDRTSLDDRRVIVVEPIRQIVAEAERLINAVRLEPAIGLDPARPAKVVSFEIAGTRTMSTSGYYETLAALNHHAPAPPLLVRIDRTAPNGACAKNGKRADDPMQAGIARALGLPVDAPNIRWLTSLVEGPSLVTVTIAEAR
jgi:hypothetical protein